MRIYGTKIQQKEELKHAVIEGEIGDGKETLKCLNYNIVFTYAVKAIQELSDIVKQQQDQIDTSKTTNWQTDTNDLKCLIIKSS